jgi:hypothetical protein
MKSNTSTVDNVLTPESAFEPSEFETNFTTQGPDWEPSINQTIEAFRTVVHGGSGAAWYRQFPFGTVAAGDDGPSKPIHVGDIIVDVTACDPTAPEPVPAGAISVVAGGGMGQIIVWKPGSSRHSVKMRRPETIQKRCWDGELALVRGLIDDR